jgi:hypothetical protein
MRTKEIDRMLTFKTRLMSIEQTDVSQMDLLEQRLQAEFPQIIKIEGSKATDFFELEVTEDTEVAPFMKAFDEFVKNYIAENGDDDIEYQFTIYRGKELLNVMTYNDPGRGYRVEVLAEGKLHKLFVVDVMGATGDFSVYNEDFELVGSMNMKCRMPMEDDEFDDGRQFPNFKEPSMWEARGELVELYLNQILGQITLQLDAEYRKTEIDIEDEGDLVYYAAELNVSIDELKDAASKVGPLIGALEDYLAK